MPALNRASSNDKRNKLEEPTAVEERPSKWVATALDTKGALHSEYNLSKDASATLFAFGRPQGERDCFGTASAHPFTLIIYHANRATTDIKASTTVTVGATMPDGLYFPNNQPRGGPSGGPGRKKNGKRFANLLAGMWWLGWLGMCAVLEGLCPHVFAHW